MGSLTNTGNYNCAKKVIDHCLKTTLYSRPSTVYAGLCTSDPGETGSVAGEATYTNYSRVAIAFSAASGRSITQGAQIEFPAAGGGSSACTHWIICASGTPTTDDVMAYGALSGTVTVTTGYQPFLAASAVVITLSAGGIYTGYATTVLDWLFRNQTLNQPTNIYVALHSTASTDTTPGTELSGNAYARTLCNAWDAATVASPSIGQNTSAITFPQATPSGWSQVVHASLYSADTGGTAYFYMDCNDLTVAALEYGRFIAGAFKVSLT